MFSIFDASGENWKKLIINYKFRYKISSNAWKIFNITVAISNSRIFSINCLLDLELVSENINHSIYLDEWILEKKNLIIIWLFQYFWNRLTIENKEICGMLILEEKY